MSTILKMPWVADVPMQTLASDAQDIADQIYMDIAHLEDMFIRYPGLMSSHEEELGKSFGRFAIIMEKMATHNGN